ncbi:MAG: aspartate kinase [Firmicutes bacterium]|nr:aspartate kinase [Bacillota bacterium]
MGIVVQKYGGTSVAGPERIKNVAQRVCRAAEAGNQVVVVVSAQGDTTDRLLDMAYTISPDPPKRELDMLLATGEQISISLLAMAIDTLGHKVISLTGAQGGILTDERHTKAKIREVNAERIVAELERGCIVIVAGFQGITPSNDITTLGRGGSDTTAVAVAAALKADICEIYTDVSGVYTADPRIVADARLLPKVGYDEMLELASLGALILQPRAVEVAAIYGVPLHVRSSFSDSPGTIVREVKDMEKVVSVTGVASDDNCAQIVLLGVPRHLNALQLVFGMLAEDGINVDMIVKAQSGPNTDNLSFTVQRNDLKAALSAIKQLQGADEWKILANEDVAKVSIVGAGMMTNPGVAAEMFDALANEGIPVELVTTSEIKVSCLVPRDLYKAAVAACHRRFCLSDTNS